MNLKAMIEKIKDRITQLSNRKQNLFVLGLIIFAVTAIYSPSLNNGFAWDDEPQVENNSQIKDLNGIAKSFTSCIWAEQLPECKGYTAYYRPTQMISYTITYAFSDSPTAFHLVNIIFYILLCYLVYLLLYKILKDKLIAFAFALLFATLPIHSEAVSWISALPEILFSCFSIGAILLHISKIDIRGKAWLEGGLYFLALISKETAILLPAIIFLYDKLIKENDKPLKQVLNRFIPYLAAFLIYMPLRIKAIGLFKTAVPETGYQYIDATFIQKVTGLFYAFGDYVRRTIVIAKPNPVIQIDVQNIISEPYFWINLVFVILLFWFLIDFIKEKKNIASFGLLMFMAFIIPALMAFILPDNSLGFVVAERYLLLPSLGILIAISGLIKRDKNLNKGTNKIIALSLIGILVIYAATVSFASNKIWRSSKTMYEYAQSENVKRGHIANITTLSLADIVKAEGDSEEAKRIYQEIISSSDSIPMNKHRAANNYGELFMKEGGYREASLAFQIALLLEPRYKLAHKNLIESYKLQEDYSGTVVATITAIISEPTNVEYWNILHDTYKEIFSLKNSKNRKDNQKFEEIIKEIAASGIWDKWEYDNVENAIERATGKETETILEFTGKTENGLGVIYQYKMLKDIPKPIAIFIDNKGLQVLPDREMLFDKQTRTLKVAIPHKTDYAYLIFDDFRYLAIASSTENTEE